MRIIQDKVSREELRKLAKNGFGNMVKDVVDVENGIMALDGELHSDEEALLLAEGSKQENLWGINLYPDLAGDDFIEFDAMINVRPSQNNPDRGVCDPVIREQIITIVGKLVKS